MAMDIGSLVGYLELDTSKWEGPLGEVGKKMPGWMAAAGATAAVAVAAAFGAALSNAINIDAANDKVAAQLGLTEAEAARAGEAAAGAYGNAFGADMASVQAATAGVISSIAGMRDANVEDLQAITEKVLTLSDGFEIEADRISQVVGQMLSTGLASSAEEGLDLLTAALQKVPAAVREDIMDATDEYGPFFAAVGMSGEEAMGALVAASEKGMYGIDKTGDAVKEFSIRATDMSSASVAAYEAAGLSAEEMAAKILAGGEEGAEGFQQVIDGLLSIEDPVARANAAIGLFGTPLEDLGVNEIPTFLQGLSGMSGGLGDVKGAADDMAASMGDNVATKWMEVQRSFEMIITTVAGRLLPALMPLMEWAAENPELLTAVAIAVGVLALAFGVLAVAQWAVNVAMFANPITWIILAIVLLIAIIVLLVANWDTVVAFLTEIWQGFVDWFLGVMDAFLGWWNGLWTAVWEWIVSVWEGMVGFITDTWNGFINWIMSMLIAYAQFWLGIWQGISSTVTGIWEAIVAWVGGIVNGFVSFLMGAFQGFIGFWTGLWNNVSSTVQSIWGGILSWFSSIPDRIMGYFAGIGSWLVNAGRDLIQGFIDGISGMVGAVGDAVGGIMDFVGGFFPHSPAKWGPFSGSGWTDLLGSGAAIMDQFTDGMLDASPFTDARISAALSGDWGSNDPAPVERVPEASSFTYIAAENQSLSSEEALFAALGSPRSPFGGK